MTMTDAKATTIRTAFLPIMGGQGRLGWMQTPL